MRVAVVGGKLQGVEVAYLARKAGWETILVDKKAAVPAAGLCDILVTCDVTSLAGLSRFPQDVDFIVPALENRAALNALDHIAAERSIPFLYDAQAYAVTASKKRSNRFFGRLKLPLPAIWPTCDFPVVVKPVEGSGSSGVKVLGSRRGLDRFFQKNRNPSEWVVQEFAPGPSFSLEVIGVPGKYRMPQVTDLSMDGRFDCKRVCAPTRLAQEQVGQFEDMTLQLAHALQLKGIMDVEVILSDGELKLLEIDARFPSQTPIAVYWSTGINMVAMLADTFRPDMSTLTAKRQEPRHVLCEHIRVQPGSVAVTGEHVMRGAAQLTIRDNFFGADEAITDFAAGRGSWVATMIYAAETRQSLLDKRAQACENLRRSCGAAAVIDEDPWKAETLGGKS